MNRWNKMCVEYELMQKWILLLQWGSVKLNQFIKLSWMEKFHTRNKEYWKFTRKCKKLYLRIRRFYWNKSFKYFNKPWTRRYYSFRKPFWGL